MAYYCGECIVWRGSSDENRYGERWCSYSRRYERSDQNTYGCKGFLYAGRAILTKVCEILGLDTNEWFDAFDTVKNNYIMPEKVDWLVSYCTIGPQLADKIANDNNRIQTAQSIMDNYLKPALLSVQKKAYHQAADIYRHMVQDLCCKYEFITK